MKIRMTVDGVPLSETLDDTEVARDFAALLPLTLTLEDYAPWGNLAVFHRGFRYSSGLVKHSPGGQAARHCGALRPGRRDTAADLACAGGSGAARRRYSVAPLSGAGARR